MQKEQNSSLTRAYRFFLGFALFVELPAVCNNNEIRIHQSLGFYSFCLYRRPADRELKKGKLHTHQSLQLLFCAYRWPLLAVCKKNKTPDSTELGVFCCGYRRSAGCVQKEESSSFVILASSPCQLLVTKKQLQNLRSLAFYYVCICRRSASCVQKE